MPFTPPYQSGEMGMRDGSVDDPLLPNTSGKPNYAPDNRKVPPEPQRIDFERDTDAEDVPADTLAASGIAIGVEQWTIVNPDGTVDFGIVVGFSPPAYWGPASGYDVYAADTDDFDADCFIRVARLPGAQFTKGEVYRISSPQLARGRTYDVALVPINADGAGMDPLDAPRATVTLDNEGDVPPDVAGFDAIPDCCDLLFTWTPATVARNDVAYYEIRQGASFAAGVLVGRAWGWAAGLLVVPISQVPNTLTAPDDEFHIKAVTRLGAEGAAEGSDTLTAAQIALLQSYCCTKTREISPTPGADTVPITSLAPTLAGVPPNINVGAGAGTPGPNGVLRGAIDVTSFVANGSRWDYSVILSDTAIAGDRIVVTEAVRLA